MVDLSTKMLLHDRTRFAITVAGVAFAVTLILIQMGLFIGLLGNASVTIQNAGADLWITSMNTPNVDFGHTFSDARLQRVRSVPGVAQADNLLLTYMDVALPSGVKESVIVYGLEDYSRWTLPWDILEGDTSDLRRGRFVFIDESAKRRFGDFKVGDYREFHGTRLRIIGRTRGALSFTTAPLAFMDIRVIQDIQTDYAGGKTAFILVKLTPDANSAEVQAEIQRRLPYNDVFTKDQWAKRSRDYWIKNTGIGFNMYMTTFLGALVGLVVVAQTLYASTMEHIREFGTVKAIGGSNRDIYWIIGKQAVIAALCGFGVGVIPSFLAQPLVARASDLRLVMPPSLLLAVFFGTVTMCLAASMISFRKVATIDPAMVFRS